jgi:glycosyltransferase involved in cell wall biosynthesis
VVLPENGKDVYFANDEKVILTVSPLKLIKGIPLLVRASKYLLSQSKNTHHIFIGTGPLSYIVADLASKFPKRIKIVPYVSNEITSFYKDSTLLLHGSLYESQGLVLGEAMLAEKPVVAFNVASIPESVVDGVTGYLAEPFNPKDLANKALRILEDDTLAKKMGLMGKERAMNLYNLPRIAGKMEEIYKEVLTNEES